MTTSFEVLQGVLGVTTGPWESGFRRAEGTARGFIGRVSAGFDLLNRGAQRVISTVHGVATEMTAAAGTIAAGGVVIGGVASRIEADFEQSMARVSALTGENGTDAFRRMEAAAREMGETTVFSARQAAEAMGIFAKAGFDAEKIIGALPQSLLLAAAGEIEIAEAADIVSKIMSGMGKEAEDLEGVVNTLAIAFSDANTDLSLLGSGFKFVGPIAESNKVSFESVTSALKEMNDKGIQGEMAGTALRKIIVELADKGSNAAKEFKKLGIEVSGVDGFMRPLPDLIEDFNRKIKEQGKEAEVSTILMESFGQRAGPGFQALLRVGAVALRENEEKFQQAGFAASIASRKLDTLKGSSTILKSALEGLAITIGGHINPRIRESIDNLTAWIAENRNLIVSGFLEFWQAMTGAIDGTWAAMVRLWRQSEPTRRALEGLIDTGGRLLETFSEFFNSLPVWVQDIIKVGGAFAAMALSANQLTAAIPLIGTALRALFVTLGPIGVAILAIGAIAGVIINNWEQVRAYVESRFKPQLEALWRLWIQLKAWFDTVWPLAMAAIVRGWEALRAAVMPVVQAIVAQVMEVWSQVKPFFDVWVKEVSRTIGVGLQALKDLAFGIFNNLRRFYETNSGAFALMFSRLKMVIAGALTVFFSLSIVMQKVAQFVIPLLVKHNLLLQRAILAVVTAFLQAWKFLNDKLMPILTGVAKLVASWLVPNMMLLVGVGKEVAGILWALFKAGEPVRHLLRELGALVAEVVVEVFKALWEIVVAIIDVFGQLGKALGFAGDKMGFLDTVVAGLVIAIKALAAVIKLVVNLVTLVLKPIVFLARVLISVLAPVLKTTIQLVATLVKALLQLVTLDFSGFKKTLAKFRDDVVNNFKQIPAKIKEAWKDMLGFREEVAKEQEKQEQNTASSSLSIWESFEKTLTDMKTEAAIRRQTLAASMQFAEARARQGATKKQIEEELELRLREQVKSEELVQEALQKVRDRYRDAEDRQPPSIRRQNILDNARGDLYRTRRRALLEGQSQKETAAKLIAIRQDMNGKLAALEEEALKSRQMKELRTMLETAKARGATQAQQFQLAEQMRTRHQQQIEQLQRRHAQRSKQFELQAIAESMREVGLSEKEIRRSLHAAARRQQSEALEAERDQAVQAAEESGEDAVAVKREFLKKKHLMEMRELIDSGRHEGKISAGIHEEAKRLRKQQLEELTALEREGAASRAAAAAAGLEELKVSAAGGAEFKRTEPSPSSVSPPIDVESAAADAGSVITPTVNPAPAIETMRDLATSIATTGGESASLFTRTMGGMFDAAADAIEGSVAEANKFFSGLVTNATSAAQAIIAQLERNGAKLSVSQRRQIVMNRRQLAAVLKQTQHATGEQRKQLAAKAIQIERDMRIMFQRVKIAGKAAWEDMTEAQREELKKQKDQLDKDAQAMIDRLGQLPEQVKVNIPASRAGAAGGSGRGGMPRPGFLARAYGNIGDGVQEAADGFGRFLGLLRATEDPAEQLRLRIGLAQSQYSMLAINANALLQGSFKSARVVERMRNGYRLQAEAQEKMLEIERMRAELAKILEERERRRLAAFRAYQETLDRAERRREEDRELFGPEVEQFTGDTTPLDLGGTRPLDQDTPNRPIPTAQPARVVNAYFTFDQELTPDKVSELATLVESELGDRGQDLSGASPLRSTIIR
jgi:TP901 family phage tail tape measure protein